MPRVPWGPVARRLCRCSSAATSPGTARCLPATPSSLPLSLPSPAPLTARSDSLGSWKLRAAMREQTRSPPRASRRATGRGEPSLLLPCWVGGGGVGVGGTDLRGRIDRPQWPARYVAALQHRPSGCPDASPAPAALQLLHLPARTPRHQAPHTSLNPKPRTQRAQTKHAPPSVRRGSKGSIPCCAKPRRAAPPPAPQPQGSHCTRIAVCPHLAHRPPRLRGAHALLSKAAQGAGAQASQEEAVGDGGGC